MFGYEWSKKQECDIDDKEILKNIDKELKVTKVVPLMFGEHCLECGAPECYKTCPKYEARYDKRCQRFFNGIEKLPIKYGLWNSVAKIKFKDWGKLEAVFFPFTVSVKKAKKLNRLFNFTTSVTKHLPTSLPRRLNYLYKEYITRRIGLKKSEYPDMLLIEIYNPNEEYTVILETTSDGNSNYRSSMSIKNGFNRFEIPFNNLNYQEGVRNDISLYPENDLKATIYICNFDLVTLDKSLNTIHEKKLPKIKCVVWDLDNTLWDGVLSEGDNVVLKQEAVDAIKEFDRRGILNSIASKNDYNEAYDQLQKFGIAEYFLCPQINWGLKSISVQRIAKILDIGIDTFAFIDDMAYEREEVLNACPLVRTIDIKNLDEFLKSDDVDVPITETSRLRRKSYGEIMMRNESMINYNGDTRSFVKQCDIMIDIHMPPLNEENERCSELIQRSNQLNLSGQKLSYDEMINLFNDESTVCQSIRVCDKFGDYGLVGVAIYRKSLDCLILEHFVLSCRAARKMIEQYYFEQMIKWANENGYKNIVFNCCITPKNGLIRDSINDLCSEKYDIENSSFKVKIDCKSYTPKYSELMTCNFLQNI